MKKLLFSQFHLFCGIVSILVMLFCFIIFFTLIYYTKRLSRLNLLIICKYTFIFFIFALHLCFAINNTFFDKTYFYSTKIISSFYLGFIFFLQAAINMEYYLKLRNPIDILKNIFNNEFKIFLIIFIVLISSIVVALLPYFLQNEINNIFDFVFSKTEENYFDISFKENRILCLLICLIFFGLFYLFFQIRLFYRNLKEKSLEHLKYTNASLLVTNSLYLIFEITSFILNYVVGDISCQIFHIIFIFLSLLDSYICIFRIFHSGFYYYYLNRTLIGCVYNILFAGFCCRNLSYPRYKDLRTSKHTESINNFYFFQNYIIDDYVLDTLDFTIQSITTGLSIVYDDFRNQTYYFKSKIDFLSVEKESIVPNHENTNISNTSNLLSNSINEFEEKEKSNNNEIIEDESTSNKNSLYNFFKICSRSNIGDQTESDLFSFNNCEDANIIIKPIFVKDSIESMNLYRITKYEIIKSLLSHKFLSLLMTNSKRIFFKNSNNLIISTYDSKLLIELHTDIKITNGFNNLLKSFFNYSNNGNLNSFLCVLLGVFRIKINNFKEIVVFVSQNPLIEKIPSDYYNYWEIRKFDSKIKKFIKLVSSKDNDSFIIIDKKDNSILSLSKKKRNLFHLDDFEIFKMSIQNDIKFLKTIHSNDFCLVVLYYEFENKNMRKNSIFIDQKVKFNDFLSSVGKSSKSKNFSENILKNKKLGLSPPNTNPNNSKKNDDTNINGLNEDLIDKEIIINTDMKKKTDEISDIPNFSNNSRSMIIQNGFDATFNNYRGLLYFRWDNIFYQKKCFCDSNHYSAYMNDVMQYFSS